MTINIKWQILDEEVDIIKMIPMGVLCLTSALSLHELTTYTPYEYELSIDRRYKVTVPEYPPIKIYYYDTKYYEMGMKEGFGLPLDMDISFRLLIDTYLVGLNCIKKYN